MQDGAMTGGLTLGITLASGTTTTTTSNMLHMWRRPSDVNHWLATATAIRTAVQFDNSWVLSYAKAERRKNNHMQWLENSATLEQLTGVIFTEHRKDSDRNWHQKGQAPRYTREFLYVQSPNHEATT